MKKHILDEKIAKMKQTIADLEAQREKEMVESHTFTAKDFRVKLWDDTYVDWSIDSVYGDPPDENDKTGMEIYNMWKQELENGNVGCTGFTVERLNPATGEWEPIDDFGGSCGGFFTFVWDDPREQMAQYINDCLPEGIDFTDIQEITE